MHAASEHGTPSLSLRSLSKDCELLGQASKMSPIGTLTSQD